MADLERCSRSGSTIYAALERRRVIGSVRATPGPSGVVGVGRLVVAGHRTRRGVATALMDALESDFAGATTFRLFTGADARGALAFYRARGYRIERTDASGPVELVWLCKYPESHA